jgi:RNA methyltransferase, TrmH family
MLSSRQNPLVKEIRQLHQSKGRREQSAFLLEGTHLLQEALAVGYPLSILCATPRWIERYPDLWEQVLSLASAPRCEVVSPELLDILTTTVHLHGVVAVAPRQARPTPQLDARWAIALDTIQDPGNLGTIIRTAAAAGAEGLWLSRDSVDADHPKVLRASAGQWFRLPIGVSDDLSTTLQQIKAQGTQIVATLPRASQTLWEADLTKPSLILLGNEGAGLSPDLAKLADVAVTIPQASGVESLNVAIAAALLLYEARRQRTLLVEPPLQERQSNLNDSQQSV